MTSIQASGGFAVQPSVGVCVVVSSPGVVARQRCAATVRGRRSAAPPRAARRACLSSSITAVCSHCTTQFTTRCAAPLLRRPASAASNELLKRLLVCTSGASGSRCVCSLLPCHLQNWLQSSRSQQQYAAALRTIKSTSEPPRAPLSTFSTRNSSARREHRFCICSPAGLCANSRRGRTRRPQSSTRAPARDAFSLHAVDAASHIDASRREP